MTVNDVLIGDESVLVKRDGRDADVEFEKDDKNTVLGTPESYDEEVVNAVTEKGFTFKSQFPTEITHYVNDDGTRDDYRRIADKLNLDDEDDLVRQIAGVGYEIELTIRVNSPTDWEVTHVFGHKLEEPFSY